MCCLGDATPVPPVMAGLVHVDSKSDSAGDITSRQHPTHRERRTVVQLPARIQRAVTQPHSGPSAAAITPASGGHHPSQFVALPGTSTAGPGRSMKEGS